MIITILSIVTILLLAFIIAWRWALLIEKHDKKMKKLILFFAITTALTSCCLSQLPTQYTYVDSNCVAILYDYTEMVIGWDNCDIPIIIQIPPPGDTLQVTTNVEISAIDGSGNHKSIFFDVVLLDTIAPSLQLNPEWTGYSDQEVGDMYRTFYGWTQLKMNELNQSVVDWDTIWYGSDYIVVNGEEMGQKYFVNVIEIPDTVRTDWWWGSN